MRHIALKMARQVSIHATILPAYRVQKLSLQINVEFVVGQEVLGQLAEGTNRIRTLLTSTPPGYTPGQSKPSLLLHSGGVVCTWRWWL